MGKTESVIFNNNKVTDLCISAHQDDIEIMAFSIINKCFKNAEKNFAGCCLTDGAGSPRCGMFKNVTNEEMIEIRKKEQIKAGKIGKYQSVTLMNFKSSEVKSFSEEIKEEIKKLIETLKPENVYTHNIFDKHQTHIATAKNVILAIKELPQELKPKKLYGIEVWRSLDWVSDDLKIVFDTGNNKSLEKKLLKVYKSQISGGKSYDKATMGRRYANATFGESHSVDTLKGVNYGIDMTELVENTDFETFIEKYMISFKNDIKKLI